MRNYVWCLFILVFAACADKAPSNPLDQILASGKSEVKKVMDNPEPYEVQVLYTQIDRDKANNPTFKTYTYNVSNEKYFYPASTVKMPVAFAALEKLNELNKTGETLNLMIDSAHVTQSPAYQDTTTENGLPTVERYVEKLFTVSDNDAYNRLYEFLGADEVNRRLQEKKFFTKSRIRHRVGVGGFDAVSQLITNPYTLKNSAGEVVFEQEMQQAVDTNYIRKTGEMRGVGYYSDEIDSVVMEPFDMSAKNYIALEDLEGALKRIVFPTAFKESERFNLSKEQYSFLYKTLNALPKDYPFYAQDTSKYDSYVKFFMFGDSKEPMPEHIKIMNKVGWAYGTLTDCSYIYDTKNKIEFFLTATILVNENSIYNDGKYEYESIGIPFLSTLGKEVYAYELERHREYRPTFDF